MRVEYKDVPEVVGYRVELVIPLYEIGTIARRHLGSRIDQVKALREMYPGLSLREAKDVIDHYFTTHEEQLQAGLRDAVPVMTCVGQDEDGNRIGNCMSCGVHGVIVDEHVCLRQKTDR